MQLEWANFQPAVRLQPQIYLMALVGSPDDRGIGTLFTMLPGIYKPQLNLVYGLDDKAITRREREVDRPG